MDASEKEYLKSKQEYLEKLREEYANGQDKSKSKIIENLSILEKAGYKVYNSDDFYRVRVLDLETNQELLLKNVEFGFIEFVGDNNRYIRFYTSGYVTFTMGKNIVIKAHDRINEETKVRDYDFEAIVYNGDGFRHEAEYRVKGVFSPGHRKIGEIDVKLGNKEDKHINITQSAASAKVVDGTLITAETDEYEISLDECNADRFSKIINESTDRMMATGIPDDAYQESKYNAMLFICDCANDYVDKLFVHIKDNYENILASFERDKNELKELFDKGILAIDSQVEAVKNCFGKDKRGGK